MNPVQAGPADSLAVAQSALARLDTARLVSDLLSQGPGAAALQAGRRVHVVAVGKAALAMGGAIRRAAGPAFASGVAVPSAPPGRPVPGFTVLAGDHPLPGLGSRAAARLVRGYLAARPFTPDDLVVLAVSGGGSALVCEPMPPLDLAGLRRLTAALLASGIDVTRINALRMAVSSIHRGSLLPQLGRARRLGLILSDNIQAGPRAVASGLGWPQPVDRAAALAVLDEVAHLVPAGLIRAARAAVAAAVTAADRSIRNLVVATPRTALDRCVEQARARGYRVVSLGPRLQGEARGLAREIGAAVRAAAARTPGPVCVVGTGEATVSVTGPGRGGRCQELAWAMLPEIAGMPGASFTALSTDGQDYLPGVMGARVTGESLDRAAGLGFGWRDVLDRNDTHGPLDRLGHCVAGRPTGTNVCDIYLFTRQTQDRP